MADFEWVSGGDWAVLQVFGSLLAMLIVVGVVMEAVLWVVETEAVVRDEEIMRGIFWLVANGGECAAPWLVGKMEKSIRFGPIARAFTLAGDRGTVLSVSARPRDSVWWWPRWAHVLTWVKSGSVGENVELVVRAPRGPTGDAALRRCISWARRPRRWRPIPVTLWLNGERFQLTMPCPLVPEPPDSWSAPLSAGRRWLESSSWRGARGIFSGLVLETAVENDADLVLWSLALACSVEMPLVVVDDKSPRAIVDAEPGVTVLFGSSVVLDHIVPNRCTILCTTKDTPSPSYPSFILSKSCHLDPMSKSQAAYLIRATLDPRSIPNTQRGSQVEYDGLERAALEAVDRLPTPISLASLRIALAKMFHHRNTWQELVTSLATKPLPITPVNWYDLFPIPTTPHHTPPSSPSSSSSAPSPTPIPPLKIDPHFSPVANNQETLLSLDIQNRLSPISIPSAIRRRP